MKRVALYKSIWMPLLTGAAFSFCLAGCGDTRKTPQPELGPKTVYLNASQKDPNTVQSRTIIGGEALDQVFWSELDSIQVYWRTSEATSGDMQGNQTFGCYRLYPDFTQFSATLSDMAEGNYTYYAAYPKPESVSGTKITYTLPAVQDGTYDMADYDIRDQSSQGSYHGNCDFMLAEPVTGPAITTLEEGLAMRFVHQCHVMRIQVPTGRNQWETQLKKLRVEFPSPVVGRMTLDLTDPNGTPLLSEGSNVVIADLKNLLDESTEDAADGNYVWLFLCPTTLNGSIRFTAYDTNGYQNISLSVPISKTLEAGRITPVTLTIQEELPVTWIDFSITGNNLGENPNFFTVTAPEGATFRNGTDTETFTVNSTNKYSLGFYSSVDDISVSDMIRDQGITITYDSENARVSEIRKVETQAEARTAVELTVPYLFAENFDGVSSFDTNLDQGAGNPDAIWLNDYGLTGWSACRTAAEAGKSLKISVRHETVAQYPGRVDTPPLSGIKEGKSVKVSLTFNAGQTNEYVRCRVGTTNNTGATKGDNSPENGYEELTLNVVNDISYDNIPNSYTIQNASCLQNCTNATRLSWNVTRQYDFIGNGWERHTWYIYLDNIRVSIIP